MVFFFSHPVVFYALLLVFLGVALFAIFSMGEEDKKARAKRLQEAAALKEHTVELEQTIQEHQKQAQEALARAAASETDLSKRIAGLEEQLQATQGMKSAVAQLKAELAAKDDAYVQTARAKQDAEEKVKALTDELEKARKELALSNQMYNGLKGQYDELEEKLSQLVQQAEQKPPVPAVSGKPLVERPAVAEPEKSVSGAGPETAAPQTPPSPSSAFKSFKIPNLRGTVQENGETKPPAPGASPA